jgi:hypothetical protein
MKKVAPSGEAASRLIDTHIANLPGWQGPMLARLRELVRAADASIVEEWKWDIPVWSCHGILCTGETYKSVVKMTFARGASVADPAGLFNSSLGGNLRRAIDFREGERIDAAALQALVRAAVAVNMASKPPAARKKVPGKAARKLTTNMPEKAPTKAPKKKSAKRPSRSR